MPRGPGKQLTKAEKAELSERALVMSIKGHPVVKIAEELGVAWNTANALVKFALKKRDIDEDAEREKSLAHHRGIIEWCWQQLEDKELGKFAQNRPAYIARIQHSQAEIDRLNNVRPPDRQEVSVTYTDRTLDDYFAALDTFRNGYSERGALEPVDTAGAYS